MFGNGDLGALDESTLVSAMAELPSAEVDADTTVARALVETGLVSSLGAARRAATEGGVYLNNERVTDGDALVGETLLVGRRAILRRGKKTLAGVSVRS